MLSLLLIAGQINSRIGPISGSTRYCGRPLGSKIHVWLRLMPKLV